MKSINITGAQEQHSIDEASMKDEGIKAPALENLVTKDNQTQQDKIEVSTENQDAAHESEDGVEDTVHEDAQQEPVEAIDKDEEEVDAYAQEKAESSATIDKITKLVTKIEETVARHKIKADTLKQRYENPLVFDQQLHQSAKTNRYDTGMSSEFLMKHLMQLDNCLSYGCASIKRSRKALVCRTKELMAQADCLSQRWLKRVKVLEKLKAEIPACVSSGETADDTHIAGAE